MFLSLLISINYNDSEKANPTWNYAMLTPFISGGWNRLPLKEEVPRDSKIHTRLTVVCISQSELMPALGVCSSCREIVNVILELDIPKWSRIWDWPGTTLLNFGDLKRTGRSTRLRMKLGFYLIYWVKVFFTVSFLHKKKFFLNSWPFLLQSN